MARYIDADKLTDKLEKLQFNAPVMIPVMKIYNVIELVEDQLTADVVEVIRCENCKSAKPMIFAGLYNCRRHRACRTKDDFCSYGKRRDT